MVPQFHRTRNTGVVQRGSEAGRMERGEWKVPVLHGDYSSRLSRMEGQSNSVGIKIGNLTPEDGGTYHVKVQGRFHQLGRGSQSIGRTYRHRSGTRSDC